MIRRIWRAIRRRIQPNMCALIDSDDALFIFSTPADAWEGRREEHDEENVSVDEENVSG